MSKYTRIASHVLAGGLTLGAAWWAASAIDKYGADQNAYNAAHPEYCAANHKLVSVQPVANYRGNVGDYTLTFDDGAIASAGDMGLGPSNIRIGAEFCVRTERR